MIMDYRVYIKIQNFLEEKPEHGTEEGVRDLKKGHIIYEICLKIIHATLL